jgi:hypothetical protein
MKLSLNLFLAFTLLARGRGARRELDATPDIDTTLAFGQSITIGKTVTTELILSKIEVCLLQDETGSFGDDQADLKAVS